VVGQEFVPQWLKPLISGFANGTAEAVPLQARGLEDAALGFASGGQRTAGLSTPRLWRSGRDDKFVVKDRDGGWVGSAEDPAPTASG
jgi:hypothetical protein